MSSTKNAPKSTTTFVITTHEPETDDQQLNEHISASVEPKQQVVNEYAKLKPGGWIEVPVPEDEGLRILFIKNIKSALTKAKHVEESRMIVHSEKDASIVIIKRLK